MKPIIKWVGGKTQLLEHIRKRLPPSFVDQRYYEPFLGGGAVLLDLTYLKSVNAVASDTNPELINMYNQVRDNVSKVIIELEKLDVCHESYSDPKAFYYDVRKDFNTHLSSRTPTQAARFIYLNKHCFNGLYRVNSKGEFNVPFNGKKTGGSFDPEHLIKVSVQLKNTTLFCDDFENVVEDATAHDFVFFDSPYAPLTPTSFTDYTKEGFKYEDHLRLADLFKELTNRGCYCMLTNHDTPLIRELYKDFNIEVVDVRRSINRNGNDRKGKEVIITNYNPEGACYDDD